MTTTAARAEALLIERFLTKRRDARTALNEATEAREAAEQARHDARSIEARRSAELSAADADLSDLALATGRCPFCIEKMEGHPTGCITAR